MSLTFTVPADLPPGQHVLVFTALDSGQMAGVGFTVTFAAPTLGGQGYREVAADGGVFAFGDAGFDGSRAGPTSTSRSSASPPRRTARATGKWRLTVESSPSGAPRSMARRAGTTSTPRSSASLATPDGEGLLGSGGRRRSLLLWERAFYGSRAGPTSTPRSSAARLLLTAGLLGSGGRRRSLLLRERRVLRLEGVPPRPTDRRLAATPDGRGYWEVAADGGVFAFGSARSTARGREPPRLPIVSVAATPDGQGYWELAADGGVFSFGSAAFDGSEGGKPLNARMVAASS